MNPIRPRSVRGRGVQVAAASRYFRKKAAMPVLLLAFVGLVICLSLRAEPLVSLSAEEQAWLNQNQDKLTLLFETGFPPIEFADAKGQFTGLGADTIAQVEVLLGVKFHKRPARDWNQVLAALESGECSIAPTIVRSAERERYALFTTPYVTIPVVIITSKSFQGNLTLDTLDTLVQSPTDRCRVAVVAGYVTERYLKDHAKGRLEVVSVPNVSEGLRQLAFGQVDALVENVAVAAYFIEQDGLSSLRVAGNTEYSFPLSVGVTRKYPLLLSAIQKALDAIPKETLGTIHNRWISLEPPRGINPETLRWLKMGALFVLFLVLSLAGITLLLKRRLNEKVANLKRSQEQLLEQTQRLRDSENLNRALFDQTLHFLGLLDTSGRFIQANGTSLRFIGKTMGQIQGMLFFETPWWPNRQEAETICREAIKTAQAGQPFRREVRLHDAAKRPHDFDFSMAPLRSESGTVLYFIIEGRDITEHKQAEAERARLEAALRQAQKIESVGRLAGGVAHDFNNMLQVILGNVDLVLDDLPAGSPHRQNLEEVLKVAGRSAALTRQLLAFARKQTVTPQVVDFNEMVANLLSMLQRLIGEAIRLDWKPGAALWPVKIDPLQIDQILVNLCLNARDAIADVGTITLETANCSLDASFAPNEPGFEPGDYTRLTVTDNGCGMNEEVLSHLFEPFFTTKGIGHGTGLGLATIYGIVKQNNGFIQVRSQVNQGSTFSIFLPRCTARIEPEKRLSASAPPKSAGELVLVVEDDPSILKVIERVLNKLGYAVLVANSPQEAVRLADQHGANLDLLITDVVMPEMNGRDLARRLAASFPRMKCLFMSGYPADVIAPHGMLADGVNFIEKPFTPDSLANKVRTSLGVRP